MRLETDIRRIEPLAESVEDRNWEFRSYLKRDFTQHLVTAINNCSVCPIVFNVFGRLVRDLWPGDKRIAGKIKR